MLAAEGIKHEGAPLSRKERLNLQESVQRSAVQVRIGSEQGRAHSGRTYLLTYLLTWDEFMAKGGSINKPHNNNFLFFPALHKVGWFFSSSFLRWGQTYIIPSHPHATTSKILFCMHLIPWGSTNTQPEFCRFFLPHPRRGASHHETPIPMRTYHCSSLYS